MNIKFLLFIGIIVAVPVCESTTYNGFNKLFTSASVHSLKVEGCNSKFMWIMFDEISFYILTNSINKFLLYLQNDAPDGSLSAKEHIQSVSI